MLGFWWPLGRADKNRSSPKTGDIVRFMDRHYRVGKSMTHASIELNELEYPLRGLWVSRDEVHAVSPDDQQNQQEQRDSVVGFCRRTK